ncbi:MAG: hypothetical protein ACYSWX_14355 [Planctomycetota bacterium]|jgi:hypothetical protein
MQHERLEPGTHLRKNQKQVLAMLRAATTKGGLVWDPIAQTGSSLEAALRPSEGADPVGKVDVKFTTDGVELTGGAAGGEETHRALALYTDTRWMLETLEDLVRQLASGS